MFSIDLNADLGEGLDTDALLMPYITSANIACGFHAGDAATMKATVAMAAEFGVAIGAHPGFDDIENFGRIEKHLSPLELVALLNQQLYALKKICTEMCTAMQHVKPHGALYNMSAKDPELAKTIAETVFAFDPALRLIGLSGSYSISEAEKIGLTTASEVFADRTYQNDGSLTPRNQINALITDTDAALQQVLKMVLEKRVTAVDGHSILVKAETICVHGDGPHAIAFVKAIHAGLEAAHITIKSLGK
jgi:UPF0271 protein